MVEGFITLGKSKLSHWAKVNYPLFSFGCLTTSPLAKISSVQNPSTCLHSWKIALSFIISNHLISNHVRFARNFTWKYAVWVITGFHKESDSTWCKKKFMSDVMPEQAGLGRLSCRDCVILFVKNSCKNHINISQNTYNSGAHLNQIFTWDPPPYYSPVDLCETRHFPSVKKGSSDL